MSLTLLSPLARLFELGSRLRVLSYQRGLLTSRRLDFPVVSVGNLETGGTGKTPLIAYLAQHFRSTGLFPVVLSRGYRGEAEQGNRMVSDGSGPLCGPREAGDEPFLLARELTGTAVWVGKDRLRSGLEAQSRFGGRPLVFLLDDGFQHLQLHRDVNLLVVDASQPPWERRVLPAGPLREPPSAAGRADAILLNRADLPAAGLRPFLEAVSRSSPGIPHFSFRSVPDLLLQADGAAPPVPARELRARRIVPMAGIARPQRFLDDLKRLGAIPTDPVFFRDHHPFSAADVAKAEALRRSSGADWIVTTAKDAVRLEGIPRLPAEIRILTLRTQCMEPSQLASWLDHRLRRPDCSGSCESPTARLKNAEK